MHKPPIRRFLCVVVLVCIVCFTIAAAKSSPDEVKTLPGIGDLKTRTLAGYALANQQYGGALFYVFMESQINAPAKDTILWLNGGPGTSSMFGAFVENGPYVINANGTWGTNAYGWNRAFNVLWMDNPVGTGFAYVNNSDGYVRNFTSLAADLFQALASFYSMHPEYAGQRLWLFGESFAGTYMASLGARMLNESLPNGVHLGGIGFGNCWVDPISQTPSNAEFLYRLNRINASSLAAYNSSMQRFVYLLDQHMYLEAFELDSLLFAQLCKLANITNPFNIVQRHDPSEPPSLALIKYFARADVKTALHVPLQRNFSAGWRAYNALLSDEERSVLFHLPRLMDHVPVLVYEGANDLICNYEGALQWVLNVAWDGQAAFAAAPVTPLRFANASQTVVGWTRSAQQLQFAVIYNAGHMSPFDQPAVAYQVVSSFIQKNYTRTAGRSNRP